MAVTYGFYDSLNHDRLYNAQQMSAIFDGIINDGVFMSVGNQFHTVAGTGMQVIVKSGRAWFNSTWTLNDAEYPLSIDAADVLLTRIDAVVLEVNSEVATRANTIKVVKGTPASTPAKPTLTNTATIHQHALAYVTVTKNITAITNSMIEIVVGKTETPYVTAILQTTDITDLYNQWEDYFQTWFDTVRGTLDGDVALNLQNQITTLERSILKADTKTAMGLPSSAVGDDAFNYLLDKTTWARPYTNIVIQNITSSGSFTFPNNTLFNLPVTIICVGGGGAGGKTNDDCAGGGGSGYVTIKKIHAIKNKKYDIIVGAGVKKLSDTNTQGGSTIFNSTDISDNQIIALGGYSGHAFSNGVAGAGGDGEAGGGAGGAGGSNSGVYIGGVGGNGKNGGGGGGGGGGYGGSTLAGDGGKGGNSVNGGGGGGGGHGWSVLSSLAKGGTSTNSGNGGAGGNGDNINSRPGSNGLSFNGTFFNESICPLSAIVTPKGALGVNLSSNTGGGGGGGGGGIGGKGGKGAGSDNAQNGGGGGGGGGYAASAKDINWGYNSYPSGGAGGAGWFGSNSDVQPVDGSNGGGGGGFSPKNYGHGASGNSTNTGDGVCIIIFYVEDIS